MRPFSKVETIVVSSLRLSCKLTLTLLMHGLFGWDTYCSALTMGLLSTPEVKILNRKVVLDLLLDERVWHAKFGCTGSYRVQMHKEQTNKLSSLYIRFWFLNI